MIVWVTQRQKKETRLFYGTQNRGIWVSRSQSKRGTLCTVCRRTLYINDWFKRISFIVFVNGLLRKLKFLTPVVDFPPSPPPH